MGTIPLAESVAWLCQHYCSITLSYAALAGAAAVPAVRRRPPRRATQAAARLDTGQVVRDTRSTVTAEQCASAVLHIYTTSTAAPRRRRTRPWASSAAHLRQHQRQRLSLPQQQQQALLPLQAPHTRKPCWPWPWQWRPHRSLARLPRQWRAAPRGSRRRRRCCQRPQLRASRSLQLRLRLRLHPLRRRQRSLPGQRQVQQQRMQPQHQ